MHSPAFVRHHLSCLHEFVEVDATNGLAGILIRAFTGDAADVNANGSSLPLFD